MFQPWRTDSLTEDQMRQYDKAKSCKYNTVQQNFDDNFQEKEEML